MLLLLHSALMLSVVKMLLKGEVGGSALNSHGNYIVDHGKSWNHVFEFLWEPCLMFDVNCLLADIASSITHLFHGTMKKY